MLGDWVAEGPPGTAEVSCTWGRVKAYILRQLKVNLKGSDRPDDGYPMDRLGPAPRTDSLLCI